MNIWMGLGLGVGVFTAWRLGRFVRSILDDPYFDEGNCQ